MKSEWISIDDAAKYLGIGKSNLYSMAQLNRIPAHKVGKVWKFSVEELDSWIRTNKPVTEFFTAIDFEIDGNDSLRIPQKEAYAAVYDFFQKGGKKAIVQLPVGCGKTGVVSLLPLGIAKGRVLVIAPNLTIKDELINALNISNRRMCFWHKCKVLSNEVMQAGPYVATLDSSDSNIHDCDQSHFVVTNIQQLASSADKWLPQFSEDYFDMILVDEGHHNAAPSWKKVFDKFSNAKVVSLTATPFRSDEQEVEGEIIYRYPFRSAMLKGYIKNLQAVYISPEEIYFTYKGDTNHYTLDDVLALKEDDWFSRGVALSEVCNKNIVDASIDRLEKLRMSGANHQIIAVACSVNHARQVRSLYAERGYTAETIHSRMTSDEQSKVIQDLRSGHLDCIVQVQMLGEGFDHPRLSVAAIFRPFRSLSPYIQFVGRIMRVVVQNKPTHPDNWGFIVTHLGMNQDKQMDDFRLLDTADRKFFEDLLEGKESMLPENVLDGSSRMRVSEQMVVHDEIVQDFFQENFMNPEDEALQTELKAMAENLGFDAEDMMNYMNKQQKQSMRKVKASPPVAVSPQMQRKEARRRLTDEVKRCARILINILKINPNGMDLVLKYNIQNVVRGKNYVVAVQLINHEINSRLNIESGQRDKWKTENFKGAIDMLEDIVKTLTRRLKKGGSSNGCKKG